jgi:hypothetical protein
VLGEEVPVDAPGGHLPGHVHFVTDRAAPYAAEEVDVVGGASSPSDRRRRGPTVSVAAVGVLADDNQWCGLGPRLSGAGGAP